MDLKRWNEIDSATAAEARARLEAAPVLAQLKREIIANAQRSGRAHMIRWVPTPDGDMWPVDDGAASADRKDFGVSVAFGLGTVEVRR